MWREAFPLADWLCKMNIDGMEKYLILWHLSICLLKALGDSMTLPYTEL